LKVNVRSQSPWSQDEEYTFSDLDACYDVTYFLVVCRVLCPKVVGATSSEGFLVLLSDSPLGAAEIRVPVTNGYTDVV